MNYNCVFIIDCHYTCAPLEYERNMVQNLPCPEVSLQKTTQHRGSRMTKDTFFLLLFFKTSVAIVFPSAW